MCPSHRTYRIKRANSQDIFEGSFTHLFELKYGRYNFFPFMLCVSKCLRKGIFMSSGSEGVMFNFRGAGINSPPTNSPAFFFSSSPFNIKNGCSGVTSICLPVCVVIRTIFSGAVLFQTREMGFFSILAVRGLNAQVSKLVEAK